MAKVLLSIDDRLLAKVDRAARKLALTRSAYLSRLAARDLGLADGPGKRPESRRALAAIKKLVADNPTSGDSTLLIRRMRDER